MQTEFTSAQLQDRDTAQSAKQIRKCVHCGFCTATCPTYVLLGDELDSPRGRIYLIKDMLENEREPSAAVVKHIDRCLSCLSCTTTCPSGVNYMHLIDHARSYVENRYRRPWHERMLRAALAFVLTRERRFRLALGLARMARPLVNLMRGVKLLQPVAAMVALAPSHPAPSLDRKISAAQGQRRGRVAILKGCAEPALKPGYQAAAVRLLNRLGYDTTFVADEVCCGALVHHLGHEEQALAAARRNVAAWTAQIEGGGLDAIIVTASGCGTVIKNYGFMLRGDPEYAARAEQVSQLAKDITEFVSEGDIRPVREPGMTIAYHSACSLQHGQNVRDAPQQLLARAGFTVRLPQEGHLCCGSAGTYNILQPELAGQLGDRKVAALSALAPDAIATGNIGCAMQIGQRSAIPVVHTVELLDWATGGPEPSAFRRAAAK